MENLKKNILQPLDSHGLLCFECHASMSCFNHCCHDMSQVLYPFDILKLKNHIGISSTQFLTEYCKIRDGETSGFPVVTFKLDEKNHWACPFTEEKGCAVYEARPASCRIFPLARGLSRDRANGQIREHYAIVPDPDCMGLQSRKQFSVQDWLQHQGLHTYNLMNDAMMPLITLKNRLMPGPLEKKEREIFVMGCYDLDGFREKILNTGNLSDLFPQERILAAHKDENSLLLLGLEWVRHKLFGGIK